MTRFRKDGNEHSGHTKLDFFTDFTTANCSRDTLAVELVLKVYLR
jgi:hypothetical protein